VLVLYLNPRRAPCGPLREGGAEIEEIEEIEKLKAPPVVRFGGEGGGLWSAPAVFGRPEVHVVRAMDDGRGPGAGGYHHHSAYLDLEQRQGQRAAAAGCWLLGCWVSAAGRRRCHPPAGAGASGQGRSSQLQPSALVRPRPPSSTRSCLKLTAPACQLQ